MRRAFGSYSRPSHVYAEPTALSGVHDSACLRARWLTGAHAPGIERRAPDPRRTYAMRRAWRPRTRGRRSPPSGRRTCRCPWAGAAEPADGRIHRRPRALRALRRSARCAGRRVRSEPSRARHADARSARGAGHRPLLRARTLPPRSQEFTACLTVRRPIERVRASRAAGRAVNGMEL
jgi:hypothetical protein